MHNLLITLLPLVHREPEGVDSQGHIIGYSKIKRGDSFVIEILSPGYHSSSWDLDRLKKDSILIQTERFINACTCGGSYLIGSRQEKN